jgi:hypothetical protein
MLHALSLILIIPISIDDSASPTLFFFIFGLFFALLLDFLRVQWPIEMFFDYFDELGMLCDDCHPPTGFSMDDRELFHVVQ